MPPVKKSDDAEYEVIARHKWQDSDGNETQFQVGDDYTGGDVEGCLNHINGPLIRKKRTKPSPADTSNKES